MNSPRLRKLQKDLQHPLLIKKKENLFYLLGQKPMDGWLLVGPKRAVFLGNGLEKIENIHSDILKNIGMYLDGDRKLRLESDFTFAEADFLKTRLKSAKLEPVKSPVDAMRLIKDEREAGYMLASGKITEKVWARVKQVLKKKTWTEQALAGRIVDLGKSFGAESPSFDPIVASGPNAAVPHHRPGSRRLGNSESIIIDFGFKYRGYCSDFTRTVFLKTVPGRWVNIYNQVERAHRESVEFVSSQAKRSSSERNSTRLPRRSTPRNDMQITACDVYQKALSVLAGAKLEKYFIHNLGHGCGLEIHESPSLSAGSKEILSNGMIFSVEPGVYLPKIGGVRIEDLVYLERGKPRFITQVSRELSKNIIK